MNLFGLIASEIAGIAHLPLFARTPMSLARYMDLCLTHPDFGYYMTRDPLGAAGDFTTAPEISQMFGELIGLWAVAEWQQLGRPAAFALAEFGPGRGTLLVDALRAASVEPAFIAAMQLCLCDASPVLREHQHARLARYSPTWIGSAGDLPPLPTIVIANEFFDALPVEQVRHLSGSTWQRRAITLTDNRLAWTESAVREQEIPPAIVAAQPADWREYSPLSQIVMRQLAAQLQAHGGRLLAIDYGYNLPPFAITKGDTLQALARHAPVDPLADPGAADLTAHVDFHALASIAAEQGLSASITTQGQFLRALGIEARAERLLARASVEQAEDIRSAHCRLTAPDEMGELFKVLIVGS